MTIDRRTLLKAAGSLALLGPAAVAAAPAEKAKWAFLYWLPYDNDLSRFAEPVLEQLQRGAANSSTLVAVQVDTPHLASMQRMVFTRAGARATTAPGHDSSSAEELAQFLEWGALAVPAENYVIAVLGHGGNLWDLSPDQRTQGWMRVDALAAAIDRFKSAIGAKPALLYLQNCNKGTIETYYALRDCAHVTLASQAVLGAPNFYSERLLASLSGDNTATSMEVAKRIVAFERADMLATLVATDNIMLDELPQRLKPLLEAVRASGLREWQPGDLITYAYPDAKGELHVDLIGLLAALSSRFDAVRPHYMEFSTWLWGVMGARRTDGTLKVPTLQGIGLYGIGIIMPRSAEAYDRYRSLPFYAQTRFWDYVPYRVAAA
jgi:Clostripain family